MSVGLGILLLLTAAVGETTEQKSPESNKSAPTPQVCEPIPVIAVAARAAGMSCHFPQRQVRVLCDSKAEKTASPRSGGCREPAQCDK